MLSLYSTYQTHTSTWEKRSCVGYGTMNKTKIMITPPPPRRSCADVKCKKTHNQLALLSSNKNLFTAFLFHLCKLRNNITTTTTAVFFYKRNKLPTEFMYFSCLIHRLTDLNHTNILYTTYNQTHIHRKIREKITSTRHHHHRQHYYHHQRSNFLSFFLCAAVLMPYHYNHRP